jgi:hypothetical protein
MIIELEGVTSYRGEQYASWNAVWGKKQKMVPEKICSIKLEKLDPPNGSRAWKAYDLSLLIMRANWQQLKPELENKQEYQQAIMTTIF